MHPKALTASFRLRILAAHCAVFWCAGFLLATPATDERYREQTHAAQDVLRVETADKQRAAKTPSPSQGGKVDLQESLRETEAALAKVDNYTAVFHRIEYVDGKLIPEEVTLLKFKQPFKIYMKWLSPSPGQEALYVQGTNANKIRAHAGGLLGVVTVNLDPKGSQAMKNSRHSLTEAGLHHLVSTIGTNLSRALRAGELAFSDHGEQTVYGRKTRELEGVLPKEPSKGYYCYRCIVNLDVETKMPIKTRIFDWEDRLVECYGYERLKLNPGLTDKDFDPKNPEYRF